MPLDARLQAIQRRNQGFRDVTPAKGAVTAFGVGKYR
jgi:hypothetical protein